MREKTGVKILIRYLIVLILGFNISLLYALFTPLTFYPSAYLLKIIYPSTLLDSYSILINNNVITLIPACISGAAYYLLFLLNFTTYMDLQTRFKSLFFLWLSFLIINVLRIALFSFLFIQGFKYASLAHELAWYAGSTILVVFIWFLNVHIFKISSIPIMSDVSELYKEIKRKNKKI